MIQLFYDMDVNIIQSLLCVCMFQRTEGILDPCQIRTAGVCVALARSVLRGHNVILVTQSSN